MPTVGQYLRELREQRKMSVEEVSRVTRMPMASVERIETDRFDELPGEVFVRGFLKSYARSLGVPADDVLARYTASRRVAWVTPLPISAPSKPARGRVRMKLGDSAAARTDLDRCVALSGKTNVGKECSSMLQKFK